MHFSSILSSRTNLLASVLNFLVENSSFHFKMAYSKTLLFLGLVFAVMLVVSSHVSARELAETTQTQESVEEAKYHGGHGEGYGHGKGKGKGKGKGHGHGKPGHGGHPGHGAEETESNEN